MFNSICSINVKIDVQTRMQKWEIHPLKQTIQHTVYAVMEEVLRFFYLKVVIR